MVQRRTQRVRPCRIRVNAIAAQPAHPRVTLVDIQRPNVGGWKLLLQGAPLVIVRAAAVIPLWGLLAPGSPRPSTPMHAAHATRLKRPVAPLHGTPLDSRDTVVGDIAPSRAEPLTDGILRRERLAALRTILYDLGQSLRVPLTPLRIDPIPSPCVARTVRAGFRAVARQAKLRQWR